MTYQVSAEVCSTVGLINFVGQYILIIVQDSECGLLTTHRILTDIPIMFDVMMRRFRPRKTQTKKKPRKARKL